MWIIVWQNSIHKSANKYTDVASVNAPVLREDVGSAAISQTPTSCH